LITRFHSACLLGARGIPVTLELDCGGGFGRFEASGLPPGQALQMLRRARSAVRSSGLRYPRGRLTLSVDPPSLPADAAYDLPLALAIAAQSRPAMRREAIGEVLALGRLGLEGDIRGVPGAVARVWAAEERGFRFAIVSGDNLPELRAAGFVIKLLPVDHLVQALELVSGEVSQWLRQSELVASDSTGDEVSVSTPPPGSVLWDYITGQETAKRALMIAAAGGHHVLLTGPAGTGKSMLARAYPALLPPLEARKRREVLALYGAVGGNPTFPPVRRPHPSTSVRSLIGGGWPPCPGDISLAHHGVLCLDEVPAFQRKCLMMLNAPLDEREIVLAARGRSVTLPAGFQLICTTNPCPCGNLGDPLSSCNCTLGQISRHRSGVPEPLADRIPIQVYVPRQRTSLVESGSRGPTLREAAELIAGARERRAARYAATRTSSGKGSEEPDPAVACRAEPDVLDFMQDTALRLHLGFRAQTHLLQVAWTIADLAGRERVSVDDVAEAVQYRAWQRDAPV